MISLVKMTCKVRGFAWDVSMNRVVSWITKVPVKIGRGTALVHITNTLLLIIGPILIGTAISV
jgi:hypothetical protein